MAKLTTIPIADPAELVEYIFLGSLNRAYRSTTFNEMSSRGHAVTPTPPATHATLDGSAGGRNCHSETVYLREFEEHSNMFSHIVVGFFHCSFVVGWPSASSVFSVIIRYTVVSFLFSASAGSRLQCVNWDAVN